MEQEFNYSEALAELEKIATLVENPNTGLDDIDRLIRRSEELIAACRAYLRTARESLQSASSDE